MTRCLRELESAKWQENSDGQGNTRATMMGGRQARRKMRPVSQTTRTLQLRKRDPRPARVTDDGAARRQHVS